MGSERDRAIVFEAWRQYEDDSTVGAEAKARAIIAAVDAQHPAPALPREVAMRIAEEVRASIFESADECASGWFIPEGPPSTTLAAIVSRHLPTDEEREAEREANDALFEAAVIVMQRFNEAPECHFCGVSDGEHDHPTCLALDAAIERVNAIRAKRGAR